MIFSWISEGRVRDIPCGYVTSESRPSGSSQIWCPRFGKRRTLDSREGQYLETGWSAKSGCQHHQETNLFICLSPNSQWVGKQKHKKNNMEQTNKNKAQKIAKITETRWEQKKETMQSKGPSLTHLDGLGGSTKDHLCLTFVMNSPTSNTGIHNTESLRSWTPSQFKGCH